MFVFISLIGVSVYAQGGAIGQGQAPTPQPAGRTWGVKVSDPAIDAMRAEMIQQVGVDAVVTARFSAAINRLNILDTRITTLIANTAISCPQKKTATRELTAAQNMLSTVDTFALISKTPIDKTLVSSQKRSIDQTAPSIIDPIAAVSTQATLDMTLNKMKSAVATVSLCPQYSTQVGTAASALPTVR